MKENIKTIFVLIIIFSICIIVVLIFGREKNSDKLVPVDMPNLYFMASKYANNYINKTSTGDTETIYNILYKDFIKNKKIDDYNLLNKITIYPESTSVETKNVSYLEEDNNYILYMEGKVYKYTINSKKILDNNFELIIIIDNKNGSFAIQPTTKKEYKKDLNKIRINKIRISKNNDNNLISSELISKEKMCILYMTDFVDNVNNSDDKGYSLLSDEMIDKYQNISNYKSIIENNLKNISTVADECAVQKANTDNENNKIYTVIDKNNNKFKFTESAIMKYKVDIYLNNEQE